MTVTLDFARMMSLPGVAAPEPEIGARLDHVVS